MVATVAPATTVVATAQVPGAPVEVRIVEKGGVYWAERFVCEAGQHYQAGALYGYRSVQAATEQEARVAANRYWVQAVATRTAHARYTH